MQFGKMLMGFQTQHCVDVLHSLQNRLSLQPLGACFCLNHVIMDLTFRNTIKDSNGELLTGRLWRLSNSTLKSLPFYSNLHEMDELAGPLKKAVEKRGVHGSFVALLMVRKLTISFTN